MAAEMKNTTDYIPVLTERIGVQKLKQMTGMLLVFPIIVIVIIFGIYFMLWRTDPLIRFIHMVWVLGFWMSGTLGMFAFTILARLKLSMPIPILAFAFISITLAIYFTPLPRFTNLFPSPTNLILPVVIGIFNVMTSWLFVLRFRKKIINSQL